MCIDKDCLLPNYTPEDILDHVLHHIAEDFGPGGTRREEALKLIRGSWTRARPGDHCTVSIPYTYPMTQQVIDRLNRDSFG